MKRAKKRRNRYKFDESNNNNMTSEKGKNLCVRVVYVCAFLNNFESLLAQHFNNIYFYFRLFFFIRSLLLLFGVWVCASEASVCIRWCLCAWKLYRTPDYIGVPQWMYAWVYSFALLSDFRFGYIFTNIHSAHTDIRIAYTYTHSHATLYTFRFGRTVLVFSSTKSSSSSSFFCFLSSLRLDCFV